jgi:hypothetical protein
MTAALEMSATATSKRTSEEKALDDSVKVLEDNAQKFLSLSFAEKKALIRETMNRIVEVADAWVADGSRARDPSRSR